MDDLTVSSALAENIDPAGVLALLEAWERRATTDPHGLMILRRGNVVARGWWSPYSHDRPTLMYSLSKSFTATALGLAVAEGLLDLDRPVIDYLTEVLDGVEIAPRMRRATLRHLVSMRSGHLFETWEICAAAAPDPLRAFFALEPETEPGTTFCYNQPPVLAVSAAIQATSGQSLRDFLTPRLFQPLGIETTAWQQYPAGRDLGFTGLFTTVDALARLGELYRNDGVWRGRQVLEPGWARQATTVHADSSREPARDWQQGYGFGFWVTPRGFRADGGWGQYSIVLPEHDLVVAVTSATEWMQDVLDDVWTHLVPAVDRPGGDDDQCRLDERLESLTLAPAPGTTWSAHLPDTPTTFAPLGGSCPAQPSLTGVRIRDEGVTLLEGSHETHVSFDRADRHAVVVGAAGHSDGLARLDLHFVQTPHRMWLTADRRTATFTAGWVTQPLHTARFSEMRAPGPGAEALSNP